MTVRLFSLLMAALMLVVQSCSDKENEAELGIPNTKPGTPGVDPLGKLSPEQYYFWKSSKKLQTGDLVRFASPDGKPTNSGTIDSPYDLQTAFNKVHTPQSAPPVGNHYIYLREGVYPGNYYVKFNRDAGLSNASLTIMPYPGEIAVFDATNNKANDHNLYVNGSHITVEGLIFTSRNTKRYYGTDGGVFCGGIYDDGYNNKFVNNIIHDVMNSGIATYINSKNASPAATLSKAGGTLLYGNIFFNCGMAEIGKQGRGNTIYLQNQHGSKRVENNLLFNSFRDQLKLFHEDNDMKNVEVIGNISFNAGAPGMVTNRNILAGSEGNFSIITISNNSVYHSPHNSDKSNLQVGYVGTGNQGLSVDNNVIYGGGTSNGGASPLEICRPWKSASFKKNLIVNHSRSANSVTYPNVPEKDRNFSFSGNRYYMGKGNICAASGEIYEQDEYPANESRVYRIQGENRAFVAVFNFENKDTQLVKIDGLEGDYKVYDAQNLVGGETVAEGTGSTIELPMNLTKTFKPLGSPDGVNFRNVPHTEKHFNVFVVTW
jgi:hypothetical protein